MHVDEGTDLTKSLVKRYERLRDQRATWDTVWQEIAEHCFPRKAGITQKDYSPNNQRDARLYDITALDALERAVGSYMSWTTPKSTPWAAFTPILSLRGDERVKKWLAECTRLAAEYLALSNYYGERHEYLYDVWGFGTGCMFCTVDDNNVTRFEKVKIGSYVFETDQYGLANALYREMEFTKAQAIEKFGEKNLPKALCDSTEETKRWAFLHIVRPRDPKDRGDGVGYEVAQRKAFASYYIEKETKKLVKEGGFDTFPFTVGRFLKWDGIDAMLSGEWGYGPGFSVLPESRQMNFMAAMLDVGIEKTVFPPYMLPDTMKGGGLKTSARAGNYYPAGMQPNGIFPLQITGPLDVGFERMKQRADVIRHRFHLDMFQLFSINAQNGREMTAFEASRLEGEKLEAISPAFDRDSTEHSQPMMIRLFELWAEAGMLPPPPEEAFVRGRGFIQVPNPSVQMTNRLALALQALSLRSADSLVQTAVTIAPIYPGALDVVDFDRYLTERALLTGCDPKLTRDPEVIAQIRQQRAQQEQMMVAAQMLKDGSQAVKNAGGLDKVAELVQ